MQIINFLIIIIMILLAGLVMASFVMTYIAEKEKEDGKVVMWMLMMLVLTLLFFASPIAALVHSIINKNRKGMTIFGVGISAIIFLILAIPLVVLFEFFVAIAG